MKEKIVVVDDDAMSLKTVRRVFDRAGMEGRSAERRWKKKSPDSSRPHSIQKAEIGRSHEALSPQPATSTRCSPGLDPSPR